MTRVFPTKGGSIAGCERLAIKIKQYLQCNYTGNKTLQLFNWPQPVRHTCDIDAVLSTLAIRDNARTTAKQYIGTSTWSKDWRL